VAFALGVDSSALTVAHTHTHTHTHFVHFFFTCLLFFSLAFFFFSSLLIDSLSLIFSFSMGTQNNATGQDSLIHTHAGVSLHEWKVIFYF